MKKHFDFVALCQTKTAAKCHYIDWNDVAGSIPAYLLIVGIVFTYNISDGLGLGITSYAILNCRQKGKVHWMLWVISLLFAAKYLCL